MSDGESKAMTDDAIQTYLKEVEKSIKISCSREEKEKYLNILENDIYAYLKKHPDSTIEDIYEYFGEPTEIRDFYIREAEPEEIAKRIIISNIVKKILITVVVIAIIISCVWIGTLIKGYYTYKNTMVDYYTEIIE